MLKDHIAHARTDFVVALVVRAPWVNSVDLGVDNLEVQTTCATNSAF
jgi:hypothetical protein